MEHRQPNKPPPTNLESPAGRAENCHTKNILPRMHLMTLAGAELDRKVVSALFQNQKFHNSFTRNLSRVEPGPVFHQVFKLAWGKHPDLVSLWVCALASLISDRQGCNSLFRCNMMWQMQLYKSKKACFHLKSASRPIYIIFNCIVCLIAAFV